jgi:hypothetical protein
MIKSKHFAFLVATVIVSLLTISNWVTPAQATNTTITDATPTPTEMPFEDSDMQGEVPSAEEQEELKSIVQSYFETRYQALSTSRSEDFKQNGFSNLVSDTNQAIDFLNEETGKLAVEIKRAELK